MIAASGFAPVSVGGIDQSVRIEAFGELNEYEGSCNQQGGRGAHLTDRPIYNFGAKEISPLWAAKIKLWTLGNDPARVHHAQTSKVMKFALVNVASGSDAGDL